MSVINVSNASNSLVGTLGQLVGNSQSLQTRLTALSEQSSTGLVSQTYGGLGSSAQISLDLNPQLQAITTYGNNISAVTGKLTASQQALDQLQQIATTFFSGTINMAGQTSQQINAMQQQARTALTQVQGLLNTQVGDSYIFAGQDSSNPPAPDTQFNAYVTSIQTAVTANIATSGAGTITATLTAASATSPFSATLGTAPQTVPIGFAASTNAGVVAGTNGYTISAGAGSTGSYVRDLIRSLATIGALTAADTTTNTTESANFAAVVSDVRSNLGNTINDISGESAGLGNVQQQLTADQTRLADTQNALTTQVSSVQNVDAATTASALTQTQTQLQISYKLIASMQQLSLLQYL